MLGHYALTLYRSLTRHRLYAAINVLGLAVGIAVFVVLSLDVRFETSFERWIPNAGQIYPVRMTWDFPGMPKLSRNFTMGGLLEVLKEEHPQLVGTRIWDTAATVRQGSDAWSEQAEVVDPEFFQVFELPLAAGDPGSALRSPASVVLTQALARRYFRGDDPLGKSLAISVDGKPGVYRVTGVLKDIPKATDLKFDLLIPLTPQMHSLAEQPSWDHWGGAQLSTYLRFQNAAQAQALNTQLDGLVDRRARAEFERPDSHKLLQLRVIPLLASHLITPEAKAGVTMLGVIGALTLLLAIVNYLNLATASSGLRAREVAVRKVMGATRRALVVQFLTEAVAIAALGGLVGLALVELALPMVNAAGGLSLSLHYLGAEGMLPFVITVVLLVGLGAGAYPAFALSRFRPAAVLASARAPGGGRMGARVREVLVAAQFATAIAFTIGAWVILAQGHHLHTADLGIRREGVLVVKSFEDPDLTSAQRTTLLDQWRALPGVASVTSANIAPGVDETTVATNMKREGVAGDGPSVIWVSSGPDFFTTYGANLLAGRVLESSHGFDRAPDPAPGMTQAQIEAQELTTPQNVVVNASAARSLGFPSAGAAIGGTILQGAEHDAWRRLTVVGVVADFRMRSPRSPVPPTVYFLKTRSFDNGVAGVRFVGAEPKVVADRLAAVWSRVAPGVPFDAQTVQRKLQPYYTADDQRGRLFTVGAGLAVLIGCVGLYGLAAFTAARRTKEIGIRKTLGASTRDVLGLLVAQFLRPVLLANVVAWPLAYLAMRAWLAGFDQRIALGPQYFVGASLLALAVAALTVGGHALRVARAEPARALRHE